MSKSQKISLLLLRLSLGWMFFYAGITKVLDPNWSAAGYIKGAKTFVGFYSSLLSPSILPIVNLLNEWGLLILGLALFFGVLTRWTSILSIILMALYYFALPFPMQSTSSYIVDEHIIIILGLFVLASFNAGKIWGFESSFKS